MKRGLKARDYIYISIYWVGLAFMWNGLHVIALPERLLDFVPEALKNTYLGNLTFVGLVVAMIVQPIAGALSDRSHTRFGPRRPFILLGTLLDLLFLALLALAGNYWLLFLGYFFLQISSNIAHGACQGFIPDLVPLESRGLASGVKNLTDILGMIGGIAAAGFFLSRHRFGLAIASMAVMLVITALITMVTVKEEPLPDDGGGRSIGEAFKGSFYLDVKSYPDYAWLIASRFLILLGVYTITAFAHYFIRDVIKPPHPAAATAQLLSLLPLWMLILVVPVGRLCDRVGRRPLIALSGVMAAFGVFLLVFAKSMGQLMVFGSIIGIALAIFLSANWALATDLVPSSEAARYLGLSNIATAGAGATARLGGPLIDLFNLRQPGLGYSLLFALSSLSILVGTTLLVKVRERQR